MRAADKIAELRGDASSASAVAAFTQAIPHYREIRIVVEHFDEHAAGKLTGVKPTAPGGTIGTITPPLFAFAAGSSRTLTLEGGPEIPMEPSGDAVLQITATDSNGMIIRRLHLPLHTGASAAAALVTALG